MHKDYLSILRALPGCHLFICPDVPRFTIIEVTEAYLQAALADRSIIGKGIFEAFPDNPSVPDATGVKNLKASLLWVLENKKTHHMVLQRYDVPDYRKGQFEFKVWKPMNKPVFDHNGEIQYIIHTVEDITQQVETGKFKHEAEDELTDTSHQLEHQKLLTNTILSASLNGIYALEAIRDDNNNIIDFRYLFVNHAIANHLKKSIGEIVGARVLQLIPENKTNGFFDYFCQVLEKGQPDRQQTYFNSQSFNGWFDFTIIPVSQDVIVVTTQDITESKESQLQMQQIVKELKRSNENLEEFAHAASHDLKEPIRKIQYFTEQLKSQLGDRLEQNEIRSFSRIENATARMSNLIDDLLLYSYVSQRPHEKQQVDLKLIIQQVLEDLELDIEEKRAHIHVEALPQLQGYKRQLQQLFQNLIANALKYSKANLSPEVIVKSSFNEVQGKLYHVIEVSDNGIGFEEKYSEKIFQMFARLHGNEEYSGSGVGLSIVKKVAENHDGFVEVESEPDEGSTFKIFLPVK